VNRYHPRTMVVARVLISVIFLLNGLGIVDQSFGAKELAARGVPIGLVPLLMLGGRTLQVIAGFTLALGIYPQWAAVALIVFLVPTTFVAHSFWLAAGTPAYNVQLINFLKNVCMCGGLLFVAGAADQPRVYPKAPST
jgi:putative oxidoreductase